MQTNGTGNFVALGQTSRDWNGIAAAPNGNVYATVYGGDIYMQTNGTGNFVALGQTTRDWFGMAVSPNGNVYAAALNSDIYMQTNGTGNFVALNQGSKTWAGMAAAPNGNVYASALNDNIYMQTSIAGTPNLNGGSLILTSGAGKGTGTSTINFQTGTTEASGTTLQTLSTKMTILGNGAVGIGTTSPNASSLLDVTSTTKGFLMPRMTTVQRDAIATPATGLQIYNTTTNANNYYDGTAWVAAGGGGGSMAIGGTITSATAGSVLFAGTSGVLAQDNANYFWDNTNKRLGIGTASPAYLLDVNGQSVFRDVLYINGNNAIRGLGNFFIDGPGLAGTITMRAALVNMISDLNAGTTGVSGLTVNSGGNTSALITSGAGVTSFRIQNTKVGGGIWYFENNRNAVAGSLEITKDFGTACITLFQSSNVSIGSFVDAGYKLDVVGGNARINGIEIGKGAGTNNTNTVIGLEAGNGLTSGDRNSYIGYRAGKVASSGAYNVSIGANSGLAMTSGSDNVYIGAFAGAAQTGAYSNVAIGAGSQSSASAVNLTSVGYLSGQFVTNNNNTAFGMQSGMYRQGNGNLDLGQNTANSASATGSWNVSMGYDAGKYSGDYKFYLAMLPQSNGNLLYGDFSTGQLKLNDTNTPSLTASAQFEIVSTTKGFLPPRMTNAERIAIASPAVGLMVYCTDVVEGLYVNKSTGWTFIV